MLGITLIQGVDVAPFHAVVQGAGSTLRIPAGDFLSQLEQCPALQRELKRYLYVLLSQVVQRAACNRYHIVEARLARWLLMTHDRAHSDRFHVTHVFLATMLGVRRVGITKAANSLQRKRLISYHRGNITILDRIGLEAVSCGCYRADKEIYEHILG
ncbi:MAG: Crp/Fnr family transcriptional regulator [Gammaproteobacteria bacterium]